MSSQKKYYLVVLTIAAILGSISYLGMSYKKEQLSQELIVVIPEVSSGNTSSTGTTLSNSGSNQSGSMSSSGNTTTFRKPNTEWKTRTLSGITYVFGEGNPKEVALDKKELEEMHNKCLDEMHGKSLYEYELCNPETGEFKYVTPEIEQYILSALSDPNWEKIAKECEPSFRYAERYITPEQLNAIKQDPLQDSLFMYYDRVFSPGYLDIDNFITIEPNTGFKKLDIMMLHGLSNFLMNSMLNGQSQADGSQNPYGDCVDRYAQDIVRHMIIASTIYMQPVSLTKD